MTPEVSRAGRAQLVDRDLLLEGRALLASGGADPVVLGALLDRHHEMLAAGLGLSTPGLERMLGAARDAGALGGKLNGSGGGGTVFALAPGRENEVRAAMERAGKKAWVVRPSQGVAVDILA
jgi:galactokinase